MTVFALTNVAGIGVAASLTQPAGGAGRKNVARFIYANINRTAAGNAFTVVLRDGATGVGTIIWTFTLGGSTSSPDQSIQSPVFIIGSANTAMTLEMTAGDADAGCGVGLFGIVI